jgi:GNAT superfamily N-acetyltransferase
MLAEGFHDVPPGHVAAVVTHLEMTAPPAGHAPCAFPPGVTLARQSPVSLPAYRDVFERVGGLPWLWFSRLVMAEDALAAVLADPAVEVRFVLRDGVPEGLLELDFRVPGACELAYFGLTDRLIGQGVGRALMVAAITRAFAAPISRFHVHTCTLDSPQALDFYRCAGFTPIRQQIEIAPDPRRTGALPPDAGPRVPRFFGS